MKYLLIYIIIYFNIKIKTQNIFFNNDVLLQWGWVAISGQTNRVTLPTSYTFNNYCILITDVANAPGIGVEPLASGPLSSPNYKPTTSSFYILSVNDTRQSGEKWATIGY